MLNFVYIVCINCINIFKIIKKKVSKYIYLCIGLFWVFFYIYLRLIATREGYEILNLKDKVTYFGIFVFVFILTINFLCIFLIILRWRGGFKNVNSSFLNRLGTAIDFIYWKPLEAVYEIIENEVPYSGNFFLFIERKILTPIRDRILNNFYYNSFVFLIVFIFDILPKLILSSTFFIETVFFGQVKYFFTFMPLFFLPIILKVFTKLLKSCGKYNLPIVLGLFDVFEGVGKSGLSEDGTFRYYRYYRCETKAGYNSELTINEKFEFVISLQNFIRHSWKIQNCLEIVTPYVIFSTSLLYFIGGLVRIIIICF